MKKLIPILAVLLLGLWIGCGDDESTNGPEEPTAVRVIANTTVSAPTLSSADEQVWAGVNSFRVKVSQANSPKLRPPEAAAIPPDIYVQAIKKADNLYLRLQWSDLTFDAYPNRFKVKAVYTGGLLPYVEFENELVSAPPDEDQIFVMFDGLPKGGYDVWNWRVLTTDGAGLGKGYSYTDTLINDTLIEDTLIEDAVGIAGDSVAIKNLAVSQQPTYAHKDTCEFDGYILFVDSAVHRNEAVDSIYDDLTEDSLPVFFYNTTEWDSAQIVPGWLINSSFASLDDVERGSRWDIKAVSVHDNDAAQYRVVLCRKLNTGFSVDEDIDLSAMDSVKVKIGIYDNQEDFSAGSPHRGFSDDFWIILK
jgi:hypothetical protein